MKKYPLKSGEKDMTQIRKLFMAYSVQAKRNTNPRAIRVLNIAVRRYKAILEYNGEALYG